MTKFTKLETRYWFIICIAVIAIITWAYLGISNVTKDTNIHISNDTLSWNITQEHVEDFDVHAQIFDAETTITLEDGSYSIIRVININGTSYYASRYENTWVLGPKVEN